MDPCASVSTVVPTAAPPLAPSGRRDAGDLVRGASSDSPTYALLLELFEGAGVRDLRALELPDTAPVLTGGIPAPEGAPTVLPYSHYDVVGAGDESLWSSPPFAATERDGALYGRGTADSKANVIAHVGALRAWGGRPPVGIRLVVEGQEEVGGGALTMS